MGKEAIDQKYLDQANQLELEYFTIVNKGKPTQRRVLKTGKSLTEFNQRHGEIWQNHEAELITAGYLTPRPVSPPARDLLAELDELKARVSNIENLAK